MSRRKIIAAAGVLIIIVLAFAISLNQRDYSLRAELINKKTVGYSMEFEEVPATDDGNLYLYPLKVYEYEIPSEREAVAKKRSSKKLMFKFDFEEEMLYEKFVLAGLINGEMTALTTPQYIINPEKLSNEIKRVPRREKFLQGEYFGNLALGMRTQYGYDPAEDEIAKEGRTRQIGEPITMQILNERVSETITHPLARAEAEADDQFPEEHYYYMLNAADDEGIDALTEELTWCAREMDSQDFIIGNEVNNRKWNYISFIPWEGYVREYANLYRVCYNAIKSTNKNARVYFSIDSNWDRDRAEDHWEYHTYIDSKDFLEQFNEIIRSEGNIDWDLSIHPYIVPPDYGKFWDYSEHPDQEYMEKVMAEGSMFSFQNMVLATDLMLEERFKNPEGKVRDIIINEIGVDRGTGEEAQAASICASYVAFKRNPYVTQYIYLDVEGNGVDSRLIGKSREVYDALGTDKEEEALEWALSYIGAKSWEEVLELYPD